MKNILFLILLNVFFSLSIFAQQKITEKDFWVTSIKKDSLNAKIINVSIFSNVNLNSYPYVFALINNKGDTIAKELEPEYFGHLSGRIQVYHLKTTSLNYNIGNKFTVVFNSGISSNDTIIKSSKLVFNLTYEVKKRKSCLFQRSKKNK